MTNTTDRKYWVVSSDLHADIVDLVGIYDRWGMTCQSHKMNAGDIVCFYCSEKDSRFNHTVIGHAIICKTYTEQSKNGFKTALKLYPKLNYPWWLELEDVKIYDAPVPIDFNNKAFRVNSTLGRSGMSLSDAEFKFWTGGNF